MQRQTGLDGYLKTLQTIKNLYGKDFEHNTEDNIASLQNILPLWSR